MEDSFVAKIVYFNKLKEFDATSEGDTTHQLSEAFPYQIWQTDEEIIAMFDEDDQDQIEIWKVEFSAKTIE